MVTSGTIYTVGQVFVPGGRPTVTYVPRAALHLERRLAEYLDERHKVLSISGPTKTGKTVLLRSVMESAVWLSGGSIASVEDFWSAVAERIGADTETGFQGVVSHTETDSASGTLSAGVMRGDVGGSEATTRSRTQVTRRVMSPREAARRVLSGDSENIIVIDDFHYVPSDVQLQIIRGVKDLVFDGLRFVVAAVPHRAYDVVRVEKEMTGRVDQLEVGFWSSDDLSAIAKSGFEALNVRASSEILARLVSEAFQSPHLMQEFCRELSKANGVRETSKDSRDLAEPADWPSFFTAMAPGASKAAFDLLARGPRARSDRKPRALVDGGETDIYGAVLRAIARTGPLTELTYEQLRGALREVLTDEIPQRHEVTRVLEEMSKIAKGDETDGEPVVDYDTELATLYISDPYFAYWLRWGSHQVVS